MSRLRLIAILGAAAALAVAPPPAAAATSAAQGCNPAGSKTLAKSSKARVFRWNGRFYGCWRATGRRHELWVRKSTKRLRQIRLAGRYVAYAYYAEPPACDWWRVGARSFNLRTGKRGRRIHSVGCDDITRHRVTDLVLRRNGSLAIIRYREDLEDAEETSFYEVIKADAPEERVLDRQGLGSYNEDGEDVVWEPNPRAVMPESLEYADGSVFWDRADGTQSAALN